MPSAIARRPFTTTPSSTRRRDHRRRARWRQLVSVAECGPARRLRHGHRRRTNVNSGWRHHPRGAGLPDVIGDDCVIGHLAHLEGCVIESRALVGSGSIVLHQATVHSGATVGAERSFAIEWTCRRTPSPWGARHHQTRREWRRGDRRERRVLRGQRRLVQEGTSTALGVGEFDQTLEGPLGAAFEHALGRDVESVTKVVNAAETIRANPAFAQPRQRPVRAQRSRTTAPHAR